ncbi:MAG: sodium:proton exchanger [Bacteroidetes bacterium]|nr:sodium:proton exchanger [Bacteroidota bacterium]MBT5530279.1 sodium:proton exchanger [Cytophagia bacterium]MBT3802228.1 sodium:proton exchanger [Bacteroidota bacterium]MBT3934629.1 sodium:proton exchanger [Bacteroidota bacterium]MBT4728500.1 sodium:proton exchanger [Bacteroidota bacterium]
MNPYIFIIVLSSLLILSYFFNVIAKKTNIPSVLLLILTGLLMQFAISNHSLSDFDFFPILELVGIVGLIMIVLEAALELELKRDKLGLIFRSLAVALITLVGTAGLIGWLVSFIFEVPILTGLIYGIPIATMSSAIVIPSVSNLEEHKREFMIYESTFSDIIGIMFFYFLIAVKPGDSFGDLFLHGIGNIGLTIVLSIVLSLFLVFISQKIKSKVRLVLLLSILFLLYTIGKMSHLSALFIILIFGLVLNNNRFITRGKWAKYFKKEAISDVLADMQIITIESSFVVRTLFFVLFGLTISITSFYNLKVITISLLFLAILFGIRFITLFLIQGKKLLPQLFIAPRGLITILLFFAIPEKLMIEEFKPGILLFVILLSSFIMAYALIKDSRTRKKRALELAYEDSLTEESEEIAGIKIIEDESLGQFKEDTKDGSDETSHKSRFEDSDWIWEKDE